MSGKTKSETQHLKKKFFTVKLQAVCRLSWLVAHPSIIRIFMKGKFDTYVLGSKSSKLNSRPVYCCRLYSKVEIFLDQKEVAFLSPSKIYENLNFSIVHFKNSNFCKLCWLIRTQPISVLKIFLLYADVHCDNHKYIIDCILMFIFW